VLIKAIARAQAWHEKLLSGFVLDALTRRIEYRKSGQAFIARGQSSAARAKKTGKYVPADKVVEKLARKLAEANQRAA